MKIGTCPPGCSCLRGVTKTTEQEVGKRPLPRTSCENLGKSVEHPEAVYSSAKWTQKHLLRVLHGWWSERREKTDAAAEPRKARQRSTNGRGPRLRAARCSVEARPSPLLSSVVSGGRGAGCSPAAAGPAGPGRAARRALLPPGSGVGGRAR